MWVRRCWFASTLLILFGAADARAQEQGDEESIRRRERATLVATKLPDAIRERDIGPVVPGITIGVGGLLGALYLADDAEHRPVLAASAIAVAGGSSYFLLPETHRNEALSLTYRALEGTSFLWLGDLVDPGLDRSLYGIASGYYGAALLEGLNLALTRHPGITRLRRDYARVASPEARRTIRAEELDAIERDLLDTERPIPHWLVGLPIVLGGGLGLVPAFESDVPSEERTLAAIFGATTILQGLAEMATEEAVGDYRSDLVRTRLGVAALPGGASFVLAGSF